MTKKRYFIDAEFNEKPCTIELISIAVVDQDGHKCYAVSSEYDYSKTTHWVREHVIQPIYNQYLQQCSTDVRFQTDEFALEPIETFHKTYGKTRSDIGKEVLVFVRETSTKDDSIEFWGYYSSYDWVVFCWLFGRMIDLPEGFPMFCRDIKQTMTMLGLEPGENGLPEPIETHNCLDDALWNLATFEAISKAYVFLDK